MKENAKKIFFCVGVILVFVVFVVVVNIITDDSEQRNEQSKKIDAYTDEIYTLQNTRTDLQKNLDALEKEYEACTVGDASVILCFRKADALLCSDALPLLEGAPAVFVLEDGKIPGDAEMLSSGDYNNLLRAGWQAALGGSFPADAAATAQWESELDAVIGRLNGEKYDVPTAYCFSDNYNKATSGEVLSALKKRGFTAVSWFGNAASEDEIFCCSTTVIKQDASSNAASALVKMAAGGSLVIATGAVSDTVTDENADTGKEKYQLMLDYVRKNFPEGTFKTFDGVLEYKKSLSNNPRSAELFQEIAKLKQDLEENGKKIAECNRALYE